MKKYTEKTIDFYNKNIDAYTKSGAIVLKNKIDRFIKLLRGKKILDVASGPGHDTDYLTRKGFDCLGIDLSEKMIKYAEENYEGKFELMDFFNLKLKENSFNGIWCSSAFIHAGKKDLDKILTDFSKILKKEGILGIIIPTKQKREKRKNEKSIFTMLNKVELEKLLIKNGFKILFSEDFFYGKMKWVFIISEKNKGGR